MKNPFRRKHCHMMKLVAARSAPSAPFGQAATALLYRCPCGTGTDHAGSVVIEGRWTMADLGEPEQTLTGEEDDW